VVCSSSSEAKLKLKKIAVKQEKGLKVVDRLEAIKNVGEYRIHKGTDLQGCRKRKVAGAIPLPDFGRYII
jgi:hypothetical protein